MDQGHGVIASCSSLKKIYRQKLAEAAGQPIKFIFLYGSEALLAPRIANRKGHFMPPSLLASPLNTLAVPGPDEPALHLDVDFSITELVALAKSYLEVVQA
jgi:gluconokinase